MQLQALRFLWMCLVLISAAAATAAELAPDEAKAIRAVVQAQLDAFRADDSKRAFSYASAEIQQMFVTPAKFLAMVRDRYPVVYRPASVSFMLPQRIDGQVSQVVQMTDSKGLSWLAVYLLEQQPDKSWRISGCQTVQTTARTV